MNVSLITFKFGSRSIISLFTLIFECLNLLHSIPFTFSRLFWLKSASFTPWMRIKLSLNERSASSNIIVGGEVEGTQHHTSGCEDIVKDFQR